MSRRKSMDIPEDLKDIESYDVRHSPVIAAYCDKIGLVSIINKALKANMDIDCGKVVKGLILNTLSGRDPLYRVEEYFSHQDTELLLGRGINSSAFTDDNIGRIFDRIYSYGTGKLISEVSLEAVKDYEMDTKGVHHDTTSVSVWGEYKGSENDAFEMAHGHSKDRRPDLKQFVISMLTVEKDLPIEARIYSGNTDDKTISKDILKRISAYMAEYKKDAADFIYTGDSALVTKDNLAFMGGTKDPKVRFISRMPATFSLVDKLIAEAVAKDDWDNMGKLSEETNAASASYKSCENNVIIGGKTYRALVIHSDYYDKRKKKRIDKTVAKDLESAKGLAKKLSATAYYCRKDAQVAKEKAKRPKYHGLDIAIEEKKIYKKGRPKGGIKEVAGTRYILDCAISPDSDMIENLRQEAGCFVMITNLDKHSPADILKTYKEQHGIEKNFGFLKDPLIVNDLFLKKTERIEALGFILVVSLLVWRLAERCMRGYIRDKETTMTGWDKKKTKSPTTFMMTTKFSSVHVLKKGDMRWLSRKISDVQRQYLDALGLSEEIFYTVAE
jgi:transposase